MRTELTIARINQNNCTIGIMNHHSGFSCFTLELRWNNNEKGLSCVPTGTYECFKRVSNKNGDVFELKNVVGRTYIQCHSGNYTRDIEGCILVGDSVKDIDGDGIPDVTNSKNTLRKLMALLPNEFILEIK